MQQRAVEKGSTDGERGTKRKAAQSCEEGEHMSWGEDMDEKRDSIQLCRRGAQLGSGKDEKEGSIE